MKPCPIINRRSAAIIATFIDLVFGLSCLLSLTTGIDNKYFARAFLFLLPLGIFLTSFAIVFGVAIYKKSYLLTNLSIIFNGVLILASVVLMILMIFAELTWLCYIPLIIIIGIQSYFFFIAIEFRKVVEIDTFGDKIGLESNIKPQRLEEESENTDSV